MSIRAKLPLYLVIVGLVLGVLSGVSDGWLPVDAEKQGKQHGRVIMAMAGAGAILSFVGVILLGSQHCGGHCASGG